MIRLKILLSLLGRSAYKIIHNFIIFIAIIILTPSMLLSKFNYDYFISILED